MDKFNVNTRITKPSRPLPLLASVALQVCKNWDSLVPIPKVHPGLLPEKTNPPKLSAAIAGFATSRGKWESLKNSVLGQWSCNSCGTRARPISLRCLSNWNRVLTKNCVRRLQILCLSFRGGNVLWRKRLSLWPFGCFLTLRRIRCTVNMRVCIKSCPLWLHMTIWTVGGS